MCNVLSLSSLMKVTKTGVLSGCLVWLMMGCSSKLQTSVMSASEPPATQQMTEVVEGETMPSTAEIVEGEMIASEGEAPVSAQVQTKTHPGIPPIDIPVEEPARPVIPFSAPDEELAAPPMEVVESRERTEPRESIPAETVPAPSTEVPDLDQRVKAAGIPSIDIPVEEPARPSIRSSTPAEELASAPPIEETEPGETTATGEVSQQGESQQESSSPSTEIFATPRADVKEPAESSTPEMPMAGEGSFPSSPAVASAPEERSPQESSAALGIPPLSFEPELPALPTLPLREEAALPEEQLAQGESEPTQEPVAGSPVSPEEQPGERTEEAPKLEEPVQIAKAVPEAPEEAMARRMEDSLKTLQDVYFEYDRFTIGRDALSILQQNAEALVNGLSDRHIVIEGHCDERGTESYNMVLGNRRASAVKKVLMDLGVPGDQLQVVSYGKEKPFCTEQNEGCWQENRRGHFVMKQDH